MAAQKGRGLIVKFDSSTAGALVTVPGQREGTFTINNEPVDITNKDSGSTQGWIHRQLLEQAGVTTMSVGITGVFTDSALQKQVAEMARKNQVTLIEAFVPGTSNGAGGSFEGSFMITNFAYAGTYNGEVNYQVTLESAGNITFDSTDAP